MFGYIKALSPELKVKEQEAYRAVYCGLCKQLGRLYGPFVRLTLSYDFAFLAILAMGIKGEPTTFRQERCVVHPLKRRNICQENESLDLSAAVATILLYHKLKDNLADGGLGERILCMTALPFAQNAYHKAARKVPHLAQVAEEQMARQSALEKEHCSCVDQASEPSAKILEAVLEGLTQDPKQKMVLGRIGYLLGRWVYLMDALDDLEEDMKNDNYNPFRYCPESGESVQEQAVASLYLTIAELIKAYGLLEVKYFDGILSNVFELGLRHSVDQLQQKKKKS